jgi:uncharacterized membrane protein
MATTFAPESEGITYIPLPDQEKDGVVMAHAVQTIAAAPEALYKLWHDVTLFNKWQEHVVSVEPIGANRSHWILGNPEEEDGKRIEFDSELTEDVPGKKIAWRSISEDVQQSGSVTFVEAPSGRGTLVTLLQQFKVPGGSLGNTAAAIAKRSPRQTVKENLRHFKELAETGEIPSVKGQPHGPRGVIGGIKEWMYGETNPTPPGTSELA